MTEAAPAPLRSRLTWDSARGAVHDGPRRYLMMRPDVLMGALHDLDAGTRATVLDALAASTQSRGSQSLRAYAEQVGGDAQALMDATVGAAADLGWGRWTLQRTPAGLQLDVDDSPFAAGWQALGDMPADHPVCAPIRGMFSALAGLVLGAAAPARECECAAGHGGRCRFVAEIAS